MTDDISEKKEGAGRLRSRGLAPTQLLARFREAAASSDAAEGAKLKLELWEEVLGAIADGEVKPAKRFAAAALGRDLARGEAEASDAKPRRRGERPGLRRRAGAQGEEGARKGRERNKRRGGRVDESSSDTDD